MTLMFLFFQHEGHGEDKEHEELYLNYALLSAKAAQVA